MEGCKVLLYGIKCVLLPVFSKQLSFFNDFYAYTTVTISKVVFVKYKGGSPFLRKRQDIKFISFGAYIELKHCVA